ncbi:MAG: c-type cytochrome [Nitrospirota bacterium]
MKGISKFFAGALIAFMLVIIAGVYQSEAGPAEGKSAFTSKNCGNCHLTAGPNTDKTFADKLKHKGPDLWFAGSKFKKDWLTGWLKDPKPIRPMGYNSIEKKNPGNHPKLSGKEAADVAEYLMTLTSKDVAKGVVEDGKPNIQGKIVFEKTQGCYGCHPVMKAGKVVGGLSGPSFVDAGKRLQGDFIYAYLKNPKALIPVKRMPTYEGILNDNQMKAAAQYITTFK